MSEKGFRIEIPVNIRHKQPAPKIGGKDASRDSERDDVPRIARLLALAWRWEGVVRQGETDYAQIAREHRLSRARVSQICSLTLLPADIQNHILGP